MSTPVMQCKQPAGVTKPVVDFNRCEGNADCVRVCPENVFAMGRIEDEDYRKLGHFESIQVASSWHASRLQPERRCLPLLRYLRIGLPREGDHAGQSPPCVIYAAHDRRL
jgi:NAD-dependent dihydropyrimidine dehydrogenase PreA subunit